jgi:hypothetical protein
MCGRTHRGSIPGCVVKEILDGALGHKVVDPEAQGIF